MALLSILTLALLAAGPAESAVTADRRPADEAAIRAHMNSIFSAYQKKDRAEVRRTHAPDWRGFLTGSRGVLRGIDAYMREAEGGLASPVRIERWTFRELDTVFYGDTAIVNYVVDLDLKFDGQPFSDTLRVIDVYRGRGRDWQQVASQVARHPDAIAVRTQTPQQLAPADREKLLAVREAVWRDFFASNQEGLGRVLSDDLIAIGDGAGP
jgi:ketosteroid isomerase-like protein